jgi:hypothetical protein
MENEVVYWNLLPDNLCLKASRLKNILFDGQWDLNLRIGAVSSVRKAVEQSTLAGSRMAAELLSYPGRVDEIGDYTH